MDFQLTEEQREIQQMARTFAEKEIVPVARELDKAATFSVDLTRKMGEMGFLGMLVPEGYGGIGADTLSYCLALEEITRADLAQSMTMSLHNSLVAYPLLAYGSEEIKKNYLTPMAKGTKLGAFALTEPCAGSDAGSLETTAHKENDSYRLNGTKIFCTNGSVADFIVVFANIDKSLGKKGITAFLVETSSPGFQVVREEEKMGAHASPTAQLLFENCKVPDTHRLGPEGKGMRIALETLDGGRIGIGAQGVGLARGAFLAALRYSQERKQFGKSISEFQAIQFMLADMSIDVEASTLLVHRAACLKDRGLPYILEAAQCKVFATEAATRVADRALQVFGGYGYLKDYPVEKYYREARVTQLYEGTSEIQRMVIAQMLIRSLEGASEGTK